MTDDSANTNGNGNGNGSRNSTTKKNLWISGSDNPGMQLTTKLFDGSGVVNWSRSVRMALGAKHKSAFVDGSFPCPDEGSADLEDWIRCDSMVTCWIINSMKSEIAESFMYTDSALQLWTELVERFGQVSAPLIYQLQKELVTMTQENDSVATYFSKSKAVVTSPILIV